VVPVVLAFSGVGPAPPQPELKSVAITIPTVVVRMLAFLRAAETRVPEVRTTDAFDLYGNVV